MYQVLLLELGVVESNLIRIAILVVAMLVVFYFLNRFVKTDDDRRSARLQRQYARLDRKTLDAVPDGEVVEAVVANLMAKQDKKRPDPYHTLPQLSRGRLAIYSVWLIDHELQAGSFETCLEGPSAPFCEFAADGMELLGASGCAKAVRSALQTRSEEELAELHADYLEAAEQELLSGKCIDYIRQNPDEFVDEVPASEEEEAVSDMPSEAAADTPTDTLAEEAAEKETPAKESVDP